MNGDGLKALERIGKRKYKTTVANITGFETATVSVKQDNKKDYNIIEKELQIFALVNKAPGELGFILDCEDFNEYVETFTSIGGSVDDSPYTEEEFNVLKNYYRGVEQ